MLLIIAIFSTAFANVDQGILKWEQLKTTKYANTIESEDIGLVVPQDMRESSSNNHVSKEIMDHTFRNFIKGKFTPEAGIVKTVQKVESSLKYDISLPKEKESDIEHKFNVNYRPFQNIARIKYRGFFNANVQYYMSRSDLEYTIEKALNETTSLNLVQGPDPIAETRQNLTMLQLRTTWD